MKNLIEKAKAEHSLDKFEIISILENDEINRELFAAADEVRKKYVGDVVHLRGLIEFSNICRRNCFYCGLRCDNKNIERYRLSEEDILEFAKDAISQGYKTIVMQSGEDVFFSAQKLGEIIQKIKLLSKAPLAVTLSVGEMSYDEYKILKEFGADRFLLRIETTDENLYRELHPNMSLKNRKRCLYDLKSLGYETGTGCLVGLPNQTITSLAEDILFFKELDADMIGIGPFIPHKQTPLAGCTGGRFELALKVMALTRLLLPDINIPATTAMETLTPNGRMIALQSGANVVMQNVTGENFRTKYEIYPGKACLNYLPAESMTSISAKIKSAGRLIGKDEGAHKRINH